MEGMLREAEIANNGTEASSSATAEAVSSAIAEASSSAVAEDVGELLREHRGGDVAVLDLREMNVWADFFVIATITSSAHLQGMERHIKEFCKERNLEILRRSRKPDSEDDEWCLIDLGTTIVHLMSGRARAFYELERLYSAAAPLPHSSASL
jgi:ribosome-associated protein